MRIRGYVRQIVFSILVVSLIFWLVTTDRLTIVSGTEGARSENRSISASFVGPTATTGVLLISPYGSKDKLLEKLKQARYSIQIWCYQITDPEVIQLLKNKAIQGLKVQVILENNVLGSEDKDYLSFLRQTKNTGIELKNDEQLGTVYVHAKTILIDAATSIISTANFTYPGFMGNREYRYITQDTAIASYLTQLFSSDREGKSIKQPLPAALRFCPIGCRQQLREFVDSATQTLDIEAQYLEDPELIAQIKGKAASGVQVRIIVGKYQEKKSINDIESFVQIFEKPNVHAKNILVDNRYLYIGSMNLSTNAIENNREIGIISNDRYALQKFHQQFEEDRQE